MSAEFRQELVVTGGSSAAGISQTQNVYYYDRTPIADRRYDFGPLISRYTRDFVGREELFTELGKFGRRSCGYFAVTAASGLGKTAIAAEIARRFQATSFFASAQENRTTAAQCLGHLCSDLIARFDELHHTHPYLPVRSETDSGFLSELLDTLSKAHGPLWLVVDALDEADSLAGRNPFLLPAWLPPGVFIVVTYRPNSVTFNVAPDTPHEKFHVKSDAAMQTRDVETFLTRRFGEADRDLTLRLSAAADGSFVYLTFLLAEIAEGSLTTDAVHAGTLPKGLDAYYEQGWQLARGSDVTPLAVLCAAREPLPAIWLSGILRASPPALQDALRTWRRFLTQNEGHWRVIHKSFVDFASEKLNGNLAEAHRAIATWLNQTEHWQEPYASRHLTAHLMCDPDALFQLVRDSRWYELQHHYDKTGATYLTDVERAARAAERSNDAAAAHDRELPYLPEETWCAVRHAALSQVLPRFILSHSRDFFLSQLVPLSAALNLIENPSGELREKVLGVERILEVHGATPSVFDRLLDFVHSIEQEQLRCTTLCTLIRYAPPDRVARVFEASASVSEARISELLSSVILDSPKPWSMEAQNAMVDRISAVECPHCGAWLSSMAVPHLELDLRERVLSAAIAQARTLPSTVYRSWTLAQLAAASENPVRETLIREAFHSAHAIAHPDLELRAQLEVLEALGRTKPLEDRDRELALDIGRQLPCLHCRAVFAACVASMLTGVSREGATAKALAVLSEIADDGERERAQAEVRRFLTLVRWRERSYPVMRQETANERIGRRESAQKFLIEAMDPKARCDAFLFLARYTEEPQRSEALRGALEAFLEQSRRRTTKSASRRLAHRFKIRRYSPDRKFRLVQEYEGPPERTLASTLTYLRGMMSSRYPLPGGLSEAELLQHARLPWDGGFFSRGPQAELAMLNSDRLRYVKNLCDFYSHASQAERAEILDVSLALIAQIADLQNRLLAQVFLARARAEATAIQAAIESLPKIVFAPYRAEAHLLLYPFARSDQKVPFLKAAFMAALRSYRQVRRHCLVQVAGPLSRLPRPELFQLWRGVLRRVEELGDDSPDGCATIGEVLALIFPIVTAMSSEDAANQVLHAAESAMGRREYFGGRTQWLGMSRRGAVKRGPEPS